MSNSKKFGLWNEESNHRITENRNSEVQIVRDLNVTLSLFTNARKEEFLEVELEERKHEYGNQRALSVNEGRHLSITTKRFTDRSSIRKFVWKEKLPTTSFSNL
ncbi:hypothetical protein CEXT_198041 [Caerostris extrusa]|uniref:Uncharacterized protein n=1 Tax=Caerostris extrusa TaxID=172846 RepID=A0AAV4XFB6_CAEEX|nr:hypothetical protein CEXT_198041 [Caerostris extrusa]